MTAPYERNPMPHVLDVRCPACAGDALFEFAEVVRIREKKDVPFFQDSDQFEYLLCTDSCGQRSHAAAYHAGLHGRTVESIRELPEGYSRTDWSHSPHLYRPHGSGRGSISCSTCHLHRPHMLEWPADALYQIDYRGDVLWAFHRESALELRDFIASEHRDRRNLKWQGFLLKIPGKFLHRGARETISRKLGKLLAP